MPDLLERILGGKVADPDSEAPLEVGVRRVVIADSLNGREAELVADLEFGDRLAVVSDADTRAALGERVERALDATAQITPIVLPRRPHASDTTIARLKDALPASIDGLIAVGSGTINDVCKAAAADLDRPYAVFGTAPSMNGYTSVTASITVGSVKGSRVARAPAGAFFDLEVCAAAPARLIRAGLAEVLCRATAQTDWLLAHLLWDRPYREIPFELLRPEEPTVIEQPEALMAGDRTVMRALVRNLVLSGFGMTLCGSSEPASQGEHLIAHYMELLAPTLTARSFHGEHMAVTAPVMATLQERILASDAPPRLDPSRLTHEDLCDRFGSDRGDRFWEAFAQKRVTPARADAVNHRLSTGWDQLRERLSAVGRPAAQVRDVLARAGAPTGPADLGWPDEQFRDACAHAREIRDRYTFLDFAADAGIAVLSSENARESI